MQAVLRCNSLELCIIRQEGRDKEDAEKKRQNNKQQCQLRKATRERHIISSFVLVLVLQGKIQFTSSRMHTEVEKLIKISMEKDMNGRTRTATFTFSLSAMIER